MVPILLVTKQEERLGQLPGAVGEDFWHPGNCVPEAKPSGGLCVCVVVVVFGGRGAS